MTKSTTSERRRNLLTVAFIALTAGVFVVIEETPVTLLIFAGTFNGLILPIGFGVLLWVAWRRRDLLGGYRYPAWLLVVGVLAWLLTLYLGYNAILALGDL
jgi:Mn2+/Fe2+ NRAMP family transporter